MNDMHGYIALFRRTAYVVGVIFAATVAAILIVLLT